MSPQTPSTLYYLPTVLTVTLVWIRSTTPCHNKHRPTTIDLYGICQARDIPTHIWLYQHYNIMSTTSEQASSSAAQEEEQVSVDTSSSVTDGSSLIRPDRKVIFINLVVLDASNAIDQQLSLKLKGVCQPLVKLATKAATAMATPERVAAALSAELPKKLVEKMATKGLTAAAELAFLEGPYVVLQMQILSVSPEAMIEAQAQDFYDDDTGELEEKAKLSADWAERLQQFLRQFWNLIGGHRQKSLQEEYLPTLIQSKMETVMGEVVAGKLESKGLEAISTVLPETKQARYFFSTLQELRRVKEELKPKYKVAAAMASAKSHVQSKQAVVKSKAAGFKKDVKRSMEKIRPPFPGKKVA